ncbi:erkA [Symbiodinium sp. KB8]|nr:erkA [Symbiodinium sp. KB8]
MPIDSLELELQSTPVLGSNFQAPRRFTVLEAVGQGAYGVVCSAKDEHTGDTVAIKKIESAFDDITFAKRTLRELKILRHLRHENLIDIRYVFLPGLKSSFEDIYVVSELMETDLASILKSPQPLSDEHCQFFIYQILRGLKFMHSAGVIHRDLKPRNLLVNSNCDLKICDYGLARLAMSNGDFRPLTEYVCTRWYRAPEVLCSWADYGPAIDMWSLGCIFAEMLRRRPLLPGKNTQHQLQLIISNLGSPDASALNRINNEKCRKFIESLPRTQGRAALYEAVGTVPPLVLELLDSTLQFNPDHRVTVDQALALQYLEQLHCPEDEPSSAALDLSDFEFERRKIDLAALREEIFLEALRYHPEVERRYKQEQLQMGTAYNIQAYRLLAPGESQYDEDEASSAESAAFGVPAAMVAVAGSSGGPLFCSSYSGFIASGAETVGLSSLVGLDSPSLSLRGSFEGAPRGAGFDAAQGSRLPGPSDYEVEQAELGLSKNIAQPRVLLCKAARPAAEVAPGPVPYNVSCSSGQAQARPLPRSPQAIIGKPPPFLGQSAKLAEAVANRGFCFHSAEGDLPLRPRSPRVVFRTAGRQSTDPPARQAPSPPPLRIGHTPGIGQRRVSFTQAPRNTFQFIGRSDATYGGPSRGSELYRESHREIRGGVMGTAKRFRSTSPGLLDRSPGPQNYSPSIAFSSRFRR